MDFDDAKENIKPLASGRDASILHASITHTHRELHEQRREHEATIHAYNGDDPLEPWYNYVSWIEQMFPSGGKESGLTQVLSKCLMRFKSEERYYQDRRMIKLFIKFIYNNKEPLECFQQLYNGGIGTMVAVFYIAWAYCYDSLGQMKKADDIFRKGIECRAEPLDELKEAHQHFKCTIAERTLNKDDDDALESTNRELEERRLALSSLRGIRKRKNEIGSVRTGAAIKSFNPGVVENEQSMAASTSSNARVTVKKDENFDPNSIVNMTAITSHPDIAKVEETKSSAVIRSIVDNVRHQENEHEPGPWNKVHDKKNAKKLMRQKKNAVEPGFSIHEDADMQMDDNVEPNTTADPTVLSKNDQRYGKPFLYPSNFVNKNRPQGEWVLPVTAEVEPDAKTLPCYNKCMVYPRPNCEFQLEEVLAYRWYKKRNVNNAFTKSYNAVLNVNDINTPFRMYPNFARRSNPQQLDDLDEFQLKPHVEGMFVPTTQLYDAEQQEEFQLEELMAREWFNRRNKTVLEPQDMDETNCVSSNTEQVQRRKSFFPTRRSLAIRKIVTDRLDGTHVTNEQPNNVENIETVLVEAVPAQNANAAAPAKIPIKTQDENLSSQQNIASSPTAPTNSPSYAATAPLNNEVMEVQENVHFKLPAAPTKIAPASVVSSKLPFEIFVEESTIETAKLTAAPSQGSFDAEETCSTQMFNICLKSQSSSTPKVEQKVQKRQFNVLRDVEPPKPTSPINAVVSPSSGTSGGSYTSPSLSSNGLTATTYSLSPQSPPSPGDATSNLPATSFSPPIRKQLSTILETSEHGTHSAVTTKSSDGTQASEIYEAPHKTQTEILENMPEAQETTASMLEQQHSKSPKIPMIDILSASQKSPAQLEATHLSKLQSLHISKTSITEGTTILAKEASQMETVIPIAEKDQPSKLKFSILEDPTEIVPKISSTNISPTKAVAGNFDRLLQWDNSTIENIPVLPVRFQEDKTETATRFLGGRFIPEDKTENFTSNLFANSKPQTTDTRTAAIFCEDEYDTHELFRQSPLKLPAIAMKKGTNSTRSNFQLTPLNDAASKRICVQETPAELKSTAATKSTVMNTNKNLLDTFMNDFSLSMNMNKLPTAVQNGVKFRDSFMPDFSVIEDTQPNNDENKPTEMQVDESIIILETQPHDAHKSVNIVENCSVIPETQEPPINVTQSKGAIPKIPRLNKNKLHESLLGSPLKKLQDFSLIEDEEELGSNNKSKLNLKVPIASKRPSAHFGSQTLNKTKANSTENHCDKSMNSFVMNVAPSQATIAATAANKIQTSAPPSVDELLASFNNTNMFNVSQKYETPFKQPNLPVRDSLIPRFASNTKKVQLSSKNNMQSNQAYSLLTPIKMPQNQWPQTGTSNNLAIFDLNAEGDTFANGINFLKNSTMLPTRQSILQEPSLHIKPEVPSQLVNFASDSFKTQTSSSTSRSVHSKLNDDENDEMSIYYVKTPLSPQPDENVLSWSNDHSGVEFIHPTADLNETAQIIQTKCIDPDVNPFDLDLINAFLDSVDFVNFLKKEPNTMLVGNNERLQQNKCLDINGNSFKITKFIGQGNYGSVYCGINTKTQKKYAFKQERPPNYWEYYICLEVRDRIKNEDLLLSYMQIEHALIGNNASLFVSAFAPYGSMITVCNKVKKLTNRNVDEYVVMHLTCELLEIIDHLHGAQIIHADLKADNLLFMKKLSYNSKQTALHLIDFGVSIDMRQFKSAKFNYVHNVEEFKCIEMREGRPWTYQLDLYGVAGIIHVLLFGKYMKVEKKKSSWLPKQHFPRYINKMLWEHIFHTLLNIRDCRLMPNLQELRRMLKQEMAEKERFVIDKIAEFNKALDA